MADMVVRYHPVAFVLAEIGDGSRLIAGAARVGGAPSIRSGGRNMQGPRLFLGRAPKQKAASPLSGDAALSSRQALPLTRPACAARIAGCRRSGNIPVR